MNFIYSSLKLSYPLIIVEERLDQLSKSLSTEKNQEEDESKSLSTKKNQEDKSGKDYD